jgi:hypothetical protein
MKLISEPIVFWLYLYIWFVVPGALVGWLLRRYFRSTLVAAVSAEIFTLLAWVQDTIYGYDDFRGAIIQLVAAHFLILVPGLMAIFTGYYGSHYIYSRRCQGADLGRGTGLR